MKPTVYEIKKLTQEMEAASLCGNKARMEKLLDAIIASCTMLKTQLEETKKLVQSVSMEQINSIPFMYKPVLRKNYYEGSYLEEFSNVRTSELKDAKALDIHNQFWQNHEVLRGNVFASLPMGLIKEEAVRRLQRYGWDKIVVDIYEVKNKGCSMRELAEYCENKYTKFLIVKEKSTGAELVLHYKV